MTGKDLIIYILENNLENEEVYKDGQLLGCMNIYEAACQFDVGVETVKVWVDVNVLPSIKIGGAIFIPSKAVTSLEELQKRRNKNE